MDDIDLKVNWFYGILVDLKDLMTNIIIRENRLMADKFQDIEDVHHVLLMLLRSLRNWLDKK